MTTSKEFSIENDLKAALGGDWTAIDPTGWSGYSSDFSLPDGNKVIAYLNKFNVHHSAEQTDTGYRITLEGSVQGLLGLHYQSGVKDKTLIETDFNQQKARYPQPGKGNARG